MTPRLLAQAACAVLAFVAARLAVAQGTSGNFADPMTAAEVSQLLERSGVDPRAQWTAIEALHTKYLEECARLRAQEIEKVQERTHALFEEVKTTGANAAEVTKWVRAYLAARRAAAELDARFFAEIRTQFPEGDRSRVSRAEAMRDREALATGVARGIALPSVIADVASILRAMDSPAPPTTNRAIIEVGEAALGDYDQRQTRLLREFADAAANSMALLARELEGIPQPDPAQADDDALDAYTSRTKQAMVEAFKATVRPGRSLRESNSRAARTVRAALTQHDADWARRFNLAYLALAYPSIRDPSGFGVEASSSRLIRLKSLSDAQREAIRQEFAMWEALDTRLMAEQVKVEDAYGDASGEQVGAYDEAAHAVYSAKVEEIQHRRDEAAEQALARIENAVGPDAPALLAKVGTHEESDTFLGEGEVPLRTAGPARAEGPVASDDSVPTAAPAVVPRLPSAGESLFGVAPMGPEWTDRIVGALGLTAAQRGILEALMRDYVEAWAREVAPKVEGLLTIAQVRARVSGAEAAEHGEPLSEESITAMMSSSLGARRERREIESRFFADLEAVIDGQEHRATIALLKSARVVGERTPELDSVFDRRTGGEENANVALALVSVKLSPRSCAKVATALEGRLEALDRTAHGVDSILTSLWRDRAVNELMEASLAKLNDATMWTQARREATKRTDAVMGAGLAAAQAKARAQREALDAALAVLDESERRAVERAYLRDAYFAAYNDAEPAAEALERGLALADLREEQRTALKVARDDYTRQREAAIESMVKIMQADAAGQSAGGSTSQEIVAHIEDMQRYAFARDAARDQLQMRLKSTLDESQQRAAGVR